MKVIFLDIDGVLRISPTPLELDHTCIKWLKVVVDWTGAVCVVTSSWRKCENRLKILKDSGIEIHDVTPDFSKTDDRHGAVHRNHEIKQWILANGTPKKFAILDDDFESIGDLKDFLVHTNYRVGLNGPKAVQLIAMLN